MHKFTFCKSSGAIITALFSEPSIKPVIAGYSQAYISTILFAAAFLFNKFSKFIPVYRL